MENAIAPIGTKIIDALNHGGDLCERDLFIRLRPVDRLALHRLLKAMVSEGSLVRYDRGRLPGPVVTHYSLPPYNPLHAR
jgi:hypothetical protein